MLTYTTAIGDSPEVVIQTGMGGFRRGLQTRGPIYVAICANTSRCISCSRRDLGAVGRIRLPSPFLWVRGNAVGHEYYPCETKAVRCCFPHVTERDNQICCPGVLCLCRHHLVDHLSFNSCMLGCAISL